MSDITNKISPFDTDNVKENNVDTGAYVLNRFAAHDQASLNIVIDDLKQQHEAVLLELEKQKVYQQSNQLGNDEVSPLDYAQDRKAFTLLVSNVQLNKFNIAAGLTNQIKPMLLKISQVTQLLDLYKSLQAQRKIFSDQFEKLVAKLCLFKPKSYIENQREKFDKLLEAQSMNGEDITQRLVFLLQNTLSADIYNEIIYPTMLADYYGQSYANVAIARRFATLAECDEAILKVESQKARSIHESAIAAARIRYNSAKESRVIQAVADKPAAIHAIVFNLLKEFLQAQKELQQRNCYEQLSGFKSFYNYSYGQDLQMFLKLSEDARKTPDSVTAIQKMIGMISNATEHAALYDRVQETRKILSRHFDALSNILVPYESSVLIDDLHTKFSDLRNKPYIIVDVEDEMVAKLKFLSGMVYKVLANDPLSTAKLITKERVKKPTLFSPLSSDKKNTLVSVSEANIEKTETKRLEEKAKSMLKAKNFFATPAAEKIISNDSIFNSISVDDSTVSCGWRKNFKG
jgi:hypothetical protein